MLRVILRVPLVLLLLLVLLPFSSINASPALAPGDLDTSFGAGGKVTTDFGDHDVGHSVASQSDGRIVVAGFSGTGGTGDFALARYGANGTLDTTFGTGGKVTTDLGGNDYGNSVASQSDGRIVVAGFSGTGGTYNFALARYLAAEPAPTLTPTPIPGVGWPGLLMLAVGLAALVVLAATRRVRAGRAS